MSTEKTTENIPESKHNNEIKEIYYVELDKELREKYKRYVGVSSYDDSYSFFTIEQNIERYAKNLAFWLIEYTVITDLQSTTGKILAKSFLTSKAKHNLIKTIEFKFPENKQKIFNRAIELYKISCQNNNQTPSWSTMLGII